MSRKSAVDVHVKHDRHLVPAMLNRRRITLKKILNRYMGLHFTQMQPFVSAEDIQEAGLGDLLHHTIKEMLPSWRRKKQLSEPIDIEVRGVAVALDEEVSFSYYRFQSLQSPVYQLPLLPKLDRYAQYCKQHMPPQDVDFSVAIERALRRRAVDDFMQDLLPVVHHMPVIRLSVYDNFADGEENKNLGSILAEDNERFYLPIADHISQHLEVIDQLFMPDC